MTTKTVTRADLAHAVFQKIGLSRTESSYLVEVVLGEIGDALARGESIGLSSFASFQVHAKTHRPGRNPRTGQEVQISARRVVRFTASDVMKSRIQKAHKAREAKVKAPPMDSGR
ncbi:integration host factor subunit alpha [Rhizobium rhizogenes]|uniref:integration host factor subunit alpha n=1 Tax=Rhizobium rhizogenes TaxID=359 RepID=UPI001572C155|nr:integration host factor subunit alpha [Rhizobium rhizogenes]NTF66024.1 integration host factor subunit alpha [Rhizobium rhizogenes]NTG97409.1 integration host factor subunit alpha [Rhizobium rhizogenes]